MSIGYFDDLADAEDYFATERGITLAWDALDSAEKPKFLMQAYNRLYYDQRFDLPTYAEATAAELEKLKKAHGEMVYYLAEHLEDEDHRKGLQAQAVTEAGIVKEKYSEAGLKDLPIPPFVLSILDEWEITGPVIGGAMMRRYNDRRGPSGGIKRKPYCY